MKNLVFFVFVSLLTSCLFYLGSCSTDYDDPGLLSLELEDQIMRGKRLSPENDEFAKACEIPVEDSMCAAYALTSLYPTSEWRPENGFGSFEPKTAADSYEEIVVDYAETNFNYKRGTPMPFSTTLEVGKHFDLLFGEQWMDELGGPLGTRRYFEENQGNIKIVNVNGHTGKFKSYDSRTGTIILYGPDDDFNE